MWLMCPEVQWFVVSLPVLEVTCPRNGWHPDRAAGAPGH